ncbi:MAG: penicillin-binding protein [Clostridia bacterium]|nr:penicillin-binding protein [Clostridia bacterium]
MNNTTRRAYVLYAFILAFLVGLGFMFFSFYINGAEWASKTVNRHVYSSGQIANAGSVIDRNGVLLAYSKDGTRKYNDSLSIRKATLHAVGDTSSFIATGVQSIYSSQLSGYDFVNGVYDLKKYGKGNDITLTLDANVCKKAYEALGNRKGTVGVYNYRTGEIICMVSTPTYDPSDKPSDIAENPKYEGVYLNRFVSGVYTPGSTFKCITAICAMQNISDLESRTFECTGKYHTSTGDVICNSVHGPVSFEKAFNRSCNCAFAQLAIELGEDKLMKTAAELGFNVKDNMGETPVAMSSFDVEGAASVDLGWAGIGQYTTLVNPCHMLTIMGAIANDGVAVKPYYVSKITSPSGYEKVIGQTVQSETIILDSTVAQRMKRFMRSNVVNYYDDSTFPGLQMCGKTGTAQIDDGESHSWFVGFSSNPQTPYAVVCVAENSGSGLATAGKISNTVMQAVCK